MTLKAASTPNIALIKYWGNRNDALRLPTTDSLSMTLDGTTETLAGEIAIAPDCQVITFDSWDDLMDDLDPDGACTE